MDTEDVRLAVYESFAREGRPPTSVELAERFGVGRDAVDEVLRELASARQLVLDDVGAIVMAHPFSVVPLGFSVMGASTLWWGGYVMDLPTLWRFASDWYTGRLDRGYTRRELSAAADYLRSVGLAGPFWGLE